MKKIALTLLLSAVLTTGVYALQESAPIVSEGSALGIDYVENKGSLIDVKDMKKAQTVKEAEEKAFKNEKKRIQMDADAINRQRALNYSTQRTNTIAPIMR